MRRRWLGCLLMVSLCFAGCVAPDPDGDEETGAQTQINSVEEQSTARTEQEQQTPEQSEQSSGGFPQFPNEPDDGWTKYY